MVQKYRKEDNAMTGKNSSRKSVKVVKTVLEAVLKIDANTASSISARDAI